MVHSMWRELTLDGLPFNCATCAPYVLVMREPDATVWCVMSQRRDFNQIMSCLIGVDMGNIVRICYVMPDGTVNVVRGWN